MGNNLSHEIVVVYGYQNFGFQRMHPPYWSIFRLSQTLKLSKSLPKYLYLEGESSVLNTTKNFQLFKSIADIGRLAMASIRQLYGHDTATLRP